MNLAVVLIITFTGLIDGGGALSCLDHSGNTVDWYTTYKAPKTRKTNVPMVRNGTAHFYLDVRNPQWTMSTVPIDEKGQAISNTLQQIYLAEKETILYLMYNDERAASSENHSGGGHTKGVVGFDLDGGFWLIHSVPKFPAPKSQAQEYTYPCSGLVFGQSFLCISFGYKELGKIVRQLRYNQPHIYDQYIPQQMYRDFPELADLSKNVPGPPWFNIATLHSKAGQSFRSFAKSRQYSNELYADLIAPNLTSSLDVETWMDGSGGKIPCDPSAKYKVYNINQITLPYNVTFRETRDHSKWATSVADSSKPSLLIFKSEEILQLPPQGNFWTCIGDINRMKSQASRGGGSVCLDNQQVWQSYKSIISSVAPCN